MSDLTATQRVMNSDFDDDTKLMFLRALMNSECRECAKEAHKALHTIEGGCG